MSLRTQFSFLHLKVKLFKPLQQWTTENIIHVSPHLSMIKSFINERHPIKGNEFNFIEKKNKKIDNNNKIEKKTESICSNVAPVTIIQTLFNKKDENCSTSNRTQTRVCKHHLLPLQYGT